MTEDSKGSSPAISYLDVARRGGAYLDTCTRRSQRWRHIATWRYSSLRSSAATPCCCSFEEGFVQRAGYNLYPACFLPWVFEYNEDFCAKGWASQNLRLAREATWHAFWDQPPPWSRHGSGQIIAFDNSFSLTKARPRPFDNSSLPVLSTSWMATTNASSSPTRHPADRFAAHAPVSPARSLYSGSLAE